MKNVQISFDEDLLKTIDQFAASSQLTRSAAVREAVKTWIRREEIKKFEDEWIRKLNENPENPEDTEDSEAWIKAEKWGDE
jgi:metal-responsive CopG/Arc/MetJ family transcriptional regulator